MGGFWVYSVEARESVFYDTLVFVVLLFLEVFEGFVWSLGFFSIGSRLFFYFSCRGKC